MRSQKNLVIGSVSMLFTCFVLLPPAVIAASQEVTVQQGSHKDDLPNPLEQNRRALRQQALEQQLSNKQKAKKVHQVAKGQFVELMREGEDTIWTVIAEFGEADSPYTILKSGQPGPLHNQIPEPDRSVNNSTIWAPDFSQAHYKELLFSDAADAISMRNFYKELSANRYAVNGDVTNWVQVPYNAAHYGRDWCGGTVCYTTWWFVRDSVTAWYNNQLAAGKTVEEIDEYLSQFDVWDRYDHDGDGNFNEPDGYIDHFQVVHAGEGQETGGGALGSDAIWSHRWYVQLTPIGADGPTLDDGSLVPYGGVRIGQSKYWIGDYTIEPENGAVGVFAHEFGHDLGLPDLYDTAGGQNSTGFWTLMSSGSYGSNGQPENGIGTEPMHMGAWEKLQLGWLNYEVAASGDKSEHKLGPATANTKQAQALFIILPDKTVVTAVGTPYAGDYFWYSGQGNLIDNAMAKVFDLPAGATLSAQVKYSIELDWDYAYLVVSTDGGASWQNVATSESTNTNPHGNNLGNGITGNSGGAWVTLSADLSAYSGEVLIGFRYVTDEAVMESGLQVDNIMVTGAPLEDAEADDGWSYRGFVRTNGTLSTGGFFNAYVAEYRNYRGYDNSLRDGPYNFGFMDNPQLYDWVEHYPYQDGLLISYWDASASDNNTSVHPGSGLILPIDAHPEVMYRADGQPWNLRAQSYDSTFGLDDTDALELHYRSQPSWHPSLPAVSIFDDMQQYWNPALPAAGVINPNTGTVIRVKSISAQGEFMQVEVTTSK
ncbi:immune inhibitor A [Shewanella sp. A32]|uniref:immune inhibitor A domain-containing protein n=1 Tax=Shewanella sp. A32 TaxID=3031327 RepID=UPI0023B92C52|nr:immune inhibitor A domain-containing protein [Shewanella sp. A32]MDF0535873.1 immune inhibitor A [Shewanella sp. A32]